MTPIEAAACYEAMSDVMGMLPGDIWIIDKKITTPSICRSGHTMEIYVSSTLGCGVPGAARALGIEYTSVEQGGFWEQSFELDGVKVFQLVVVDE